MRRSRYATPPTGSREQDLATASADPFQGLNANPVMAASRRLRVSKGGLYAPTPAGQRQRHRILGVDNEQQAQASYLQAHKNDDFFRKNTAARAADPSRPQAPVKPRTPNAPISVSGGGQALNTSGPNATKQPVIRYSPSRSPNSEPADIDDGSTPAAPAKPAPGRALATPPGVDPVRTSAKGTPAASAFKGLPTKNNDQYLADRISKDPARQGLDATGLPKKKKDALA